MANHQLSDETRYRLIKLIEENPRISQRDLAAELGMSLGKVNYCVRALINIGWIKMGNFTRSRNKIGYAYSLTPKGIKEKASIAVAFLKSKQEQYERLQDEIRCLQLEISNGKAKHQKLKVSNVEK
jgi:EPS-associated MarR family transcriptional regulator